MSTISTDVTIVTEEKALPTIAGTTLTHSGMYIGDKPLYKGGEALLEHKFNPTFKGDKGIIVSIRGTKTLIVLKDINQVNENAKNILIHNLASAMKWKVFDGMPIAKVSDMMAGAGNIKGLTLPKCPLEASSTMDFPRMSSLYLTEENIGKVANQLRQLFTITTQIAAPTEA